MILWYSSSLLLLVATLGLTPNTEIETWAKQEATMRLKMKDNNNKEEEDSMSEVFGTHHVNVKKEQDAAYWDRFSFKSTRWGEDDDDDDDEEEDDE